MTFRSTKIFAKKQNLHSSTAEVCRGCGGNVTGAGYKSWICQDLLPMWSHRKYLSQSDYAKSFVMSSKCYMFVIF